ncbi:hypothetical protein LXA43DRAFT_82822 [Ganoderma leucocontextum]|nr:hypothetical protein LXA43DRAFT_82822 [Ganoderma leucocontextum]
MATDGTTVAGDNPHPLAPTPVDQPTMQWDGDRMFNIYIHDYCIKRGFRKTAHELQVEASIPLTATPPINAKQGLLFEWWSVFWVLFTAKSNSQGPEDAILYTQHQAHVQAAVQKQQQTRPGPPGQPPAGRFAANGVRPPNSGGPQPNGVAPPPGQQPGPLPNGAPSAVPFPGNGPQPNGVPGPSAGPPGGPPPQGPNMPQGPPNQRPVPPQRGMNGGPFHSPTMAHSSPNAQGGPQQHNPMAGVGQNQALAQMRGMPPNGPPGAQHTPQQQYQTLVGRSPSNPGSPAVQQSPSMAHRQVPGVPGMAGMSMTPEMLTSELNRIPPPSLAKLKQDLGMGDKDLTIMTPEEKTQLVQLFRRGTMKPPNAPGPSSMPPGQPGPGPMQPPPGFRNVSHPPNGQQQPPGQSQPHRGAKRNSTSPGQEAEQLPGSRNESSPPANKRVRRSPAGEHAQPPMTPMYPPQGGHPGQPMHPQMPPNGMMVRPGMPFNGPPMAPMSNPMLGHGLATQQMSPMQHPMNPPIMQPGPGMVNPQIHQVRVVPRLWSTSYIDHGVLQYRQAMQHIHKPPNMPQHMMPVGAPSPAADGQGGQPPNRMVQGKMGMMPPPSPAMAAKTPGGGPKQDDGGVPNGRVDMSPQNAGAGIGGLAFSGQAAARIGAVIRVVWPRGCATRWGFGQGDKHGLVESCVRVESCGEWRVESGEW